MMGSLSNSAKYIIKWAGTFEPFYNRTDNPLMYRKIHYWMWFHVVRAYMCKCGSSDNMNMALIPGKKYDFNLDNFEPLCNSCNQKQDFTKEKSQAASRNRAKEWAEGKFANRDETNMIYNKNK